MRCRRAISLLRRLVLMFQDGAYKSGGAPAILMENSGYVLMEDGSHILLE